MRIFPEDKKKRKRILKANEIEVIDRQKNRSALCNKPLKINRYHIDHKKSLVVVLMKWITYRLYVHIVMT